MDTLKRVYQYYRLLCKHLPCKYRIYSISYIDGLGDIILFSLYL